MQINKLDKMEARFISLEDQLSDPSVIADQINGENFQRAF